MDRNIAKSEDDPDVTEFQQLLVDSQVRVQRRRRQAISALTAFLASILATFLLSDLGPFHSHWPRFGKPLVMFFDVALLFAVIECGFWWSEYSSGREIKRDFRELMEDRYGVNTK